MDSFIVGITEFAVNLSVSLLFFWYKLLTINSGFSFIVFGLLTILSALFLAKFDEDHNDVLMIYLRRSQLLDGSTDSSPLVV